MAFFPPISTIYIKKSKKSRKKSYSIFSFEAISRLNFENFLNFLYRWMNAKKYCIGHVNFESWHERGQNFIWTVNHPSYGTASNTPQSLWTIAYGPYAQFWILKLILRHCNWAFGGSWKVNLTEVVWFIAMRSFNWIYFRKINLSSRSARKKTIL